MKKLLVLLILTVSFSASVMAGEKETGRFDRGVGKMNSVFIPKGYIGGGLDFSYSTYDVGNAAGDSGYSMLFSLLSGIQGSMYTFGISPSCSYFIADNLSVGVRFDYDRSKLDVGSLGLSLGDLASLDINDYHMMENSYSTCVAGRYYMPIANSRRIAMFGEVRLGFDWGQSTSYSVRDGRNLGTYQSMYGASLGVVPGLCVFATNEICVEVAIGILGLTYEHISQDANNVETSTMQHSNANFKINPLSISLGMSFYLPVSVQKEGGKK